MRNAKLCLLTSLLLLYFISATRRRKDPWNRLFRNCPDATTTDSWATESSMTSKYYSLYKHIVNECTVYVILYAKMICKKNPSNKLSIVSILMDKIKSSWHFFFPHAILHATVKSDPRLHFICSNDFTFLHLKTLSYCK